MILLGMWRVRLGATPLRDWTFAQNGTLTSSVGEQSGKWQYQKEQKRIYITWDSAPGTWDSLELPLDANGSRGKTHLDTSYSVEAKKLPAASAEAKNGSLFRLEGHQATLAGVEFSTDGRNVLSGGWDGSLRLWNVENGMEVRRVDSHALAIQTMAISRDGRKALVGNGDLSVRLLDIETGKELQHCFDLPQNEGLLCVALSPDERLAAVGCHGKTIRLRDLAAGKDLPPLRGHDQLVHDLCFSPDGR